MPSSYGGNVSLLLRGDGSNNSQAFVDSSPIPKIITATSSAIISTAQEKYGGSSIYFSGSSAQYLFSPHTGDLSIEPGLPWTISGWIYPTRTNNGAQSGFRAICTKRPYNSDANSNYNIMLWYNSEKLGFYNGSVYLSAASIPQNAWTHFEYDCDGSDSKLFLNGVLDSTFNGMKTGPETSTGLYVGSFLDGTGTWDNYGGYIENLEIVKGLTKHWSTGFTPGDLDDPAAASVILLPQLVVADDVDGGGFRVCGTIDELGVYGPYRCRLLDKQSGRLVREVWSDAEGNYAFNYIANCESGYVAIAHDHGANPVNAAISDQLTLEPMP